MTNTETKWLKEIRDNTKQLKRIADKLDVIARLVANKSEADTPQTEEYDLRDEQEYNDRWQTDCGWGEPNE